MSKHLFLLSHPPLLRALAAALPLGLLSVPALADHSEEPAKSAGTVVITGGQPTSLPSQIPATMEGMTAQQIETRINASDSEDALKYLPSLLVRKRYAGDYNHAVLSSRASGTGNSARSAVYADGILLSNYLGNGATYAPRWGMVTPEEIERVDVMYGPFSAAYRGNSAGAVIDYVTRMPKQFTAHAKISLSEQNFDLYQSHAHYQGTQASAALGNRHGAFSWWLDVSQQDSLGQPLTFATRAVSSSKPASNAVAVSGAWGDLDRTNTPWWILGTGTAYHTLQQHGKLKLAYDLSPTLRAAYTFGLWQNRADARSESYLRDASGKPVYSGNISIDGRGYALAANDFPQGRDRLEHWMHALHLKQHTRGAFDWELSASKFDYRSDLQRSASGSPPAANNGGAGTLQDQSGTGWQALAAKATWRPQGEQGAHIIDFGAQFENYRLHILKSNLANWITDNSGTLANEVAGRSHLYSLWAQERWKFAPDWQAVLGLRLENWQASDGMTRFSASNQQQYASREEHYASPKLALAWQARENTVFKAALGRAVRMPTVSELYGATSSANSQYINDPNLSPEKSWTGELSIEQQFGKQQLRATVFHENVRDALYSQTVFDSRANANISRVQNVGRISTSGVELAWNAPGLIARDFDLDASLTWADSRIRENSGFVSTPGDTIDKYQPRVPVWRASVVGSWRFAPNWQATLAARYSGKQYSTLNNSDPNGFAYTAASKYFTADARVVWQLDKQWKLALGVDNLNNYKYWNFHPYPQRTWQAELKWDI